MSLRHGFRSLAQTHLYAWVLYWPQTYRTFCSRVESLGWEPVYSKVKSSSDCHLCFLHHFRLAKKICVMSNNISKVWDWKQVILKLSLMEEVNLISEGLFQCCLCLSPVLCWNLWCFWPFPPASCCSLQTRHGQEPLSELPAQQTAGKCLM